MFSIKPLRIRRGITLIEVIVTLVILGLIIAMTFPNISSNRNRNRRTECQNNLRNVCMAMQTYATAHRGDLPPLAGGSEIPNPLVGPGTAVRSPMPWPVTIMPNLEQAELYNRLLVDHGLATSSERVHEYAQVPIKVFNCPDTINSHQGGLSYVANAGLIPADVWFKADTHAGELPAAWDFGFNGYGGKQHNIDDETVFEAASLFWRVPTGDADAPPARRSNLDYVSAADGTSSTVILSENLHTRSYNPQTRTGGWISTATGDIAFGIAVPVTRNGPHCRVPLSTTTGGLGSVDGGLPKALIFSETPVPPECRLNANLRTAISGQSPRPSSAHPGVVNIAFADGSCRVVAEKLDPSIYARLLTPGGGTHGQMPILELDF